MKEIEEILRLEEVCIKQFEKLKGKSDIQSLRTSNRVTKLDTISMNRQMSFKKLNEIKRGGTIMKKCEGRVFKYNGKVFIILENKFDFIPGFRFRKRGYECISVSKYLSNIKRQSVIHKLIKERRLNKGTLENGRVIKYL